MGTIKVHAGACGTVAGNNLLGMHFLCVGVRLFVACFGVVVEMESKMDGLDVSLGLVLRQRLQF